MRCLGTFCTGGMGPRPRAPRDQGCGPVLSAICRALRCSTHEPFRGFADGFPGREGASSFPTLFISLWLHSSFSSAEQSKVLLPCSSTKLTDLARFLELKPKFQFCVSVRTFPHLSQQQAAAISAQHGPRLTATDGSLKAFCPRSGVGDSAAWAIVGALRRSSSGLSSNGASPGGTASCEEVGERWASQRALPGVQVVDGPGITNNDVSDGSILLQWLQR